jgi:hypothetical protein
VVCVECIEGVLVGGTGGDGHVVAYFAGVHIFFLIFFI